MDLMEGHPMETTQPPDDVIGGTEEIISDEPIILHTNSGVISELVNEDMVYEEVVPEGLVVERTSLAGDKDIMLDQGDQGFHYEGGCLEITRRRLSHEREGNCYCGKDRNLNIAELLCASCNRWFHESCIGYQLGKLVPFMMNYIFMCKNCSPTGLETFKRSHAQLSQMCLTAVANLTQSCVKDGTNRKLFSKDRDIIPYLEMHWDALTTARRVTSSWHTTVLKTLQKDAGSLYLMEEKMSEPGVPYFGLISSDLTNIRPNYEVMIKSGQLKLQDSSSTTGPGSSLRGRGARRRNAIETSTLNQGALIAKKTRDLFITKLPAGHGYPPDHPYNKEGLRYLLAEPDSNSPFRQEFDESSDWDRKPIPPWLYRVLIPSTVLLTLHDRAPQLKISDDRLTVTGDKGYSLVRATHGVNRGSWYFEAKIVDLPEGGAARIGFGQVHANLQGPLGYDKFGYSWRSRYGTVFHDARGKSYCKGGYGLNDVLGLLIILPEETASTPLLPNSSKDKALVRFRSHLYYEDNLYEAGRKDDISLSSHRMSKIIGFKNGVCQGVAFRDLYQGSYYPTVSVYRSTAVKVNFGPDLWVQPDTDIPFKMFSEKAELSIVEQTLADMLYLTEHHGELRLE